MHVLNSRANKTPSQSNEHDQTAIWQQVHRKANVIKSLSVTPAISSAPTALLRFKQQKSSVGMYTQERKKKEVVRFLSAFTFALPILVHKLNHTKKETKTTDEKNNNKQTKKTNKKKPQPNPVTKLTRQKTYNSVHKRDSVHKQSLRK